MKNDKLFDMLEEFKVDDEYIDEAMLGGSDSRGIKVYEGKTRPMKIVAPVAACLAVFAAAGLVFANRDKLPSRPDNSAISPASSGESNESAENSTVDGTENEHSEYIDPYYIHPSLYPELVDKCKNVVMSTFAQTLQGDVTWQIASINIDYDNSNELLLCPRINGKSVKGVGVCVFKRYKPIGEAEYIGSFGAEFDSINLDNIYFIRNEKTKTSYYFNNCEGYERCTDSLQKLYVDNNAVRDEDYLRLVKTYSGGTASETAYRYGEMISTEELLSEWNSTMTLEGNDPSVLPLPGDPSDAHLEKADCVKLLVDKYNVTASVETLHRNIQYIDVNNDGEDETVIQFRNCEQLRGIYVFSADGKLIGEFDLEDERGDYWGIGNSENTLTRFNTELTPYVDDNGERFYFYNTRRGKTRVGPGHEWWLEEEINRIVVNADGTLSAVKILEANWEGGGSFFINGNEVPKEEFFEESEKYSKCLYPFIKDPFVW